MISASVVGRWHSVPTRTKGMVEDMNIKLVKAIFLIGAIYEVFIGFMGIVFPFMAFEMYELAPPNHVGYVQFPSLVLLIFGAMFYRISKDPVSNRILMLYGAALKVGYSGIIFYYMMTTGIPSMWVPWAWADLVFLALFILSWRYTGGLTSQAAQE